MISKIVKTCNKITNKKEKEMNKKLVKSFMTILFVIALSASFSVAQNMDSMKMDHENMQNMHMESDSTGIMKMDHEHMKNMNMESDSGSTMKMDSAASVKNSIVREGIIDLKAIDENKDGKVYQDMMDYNVISDKPGTCPLCGMTLKEVTLKKAKELLLKSGYKVIE